MSDGKIDINSVTWGVVKRWVDGQIAQAQTALELRSTGPVETEFWRGRISALRELLRQAAPELPLPPMESSFEV